MIDLSLYVGALMVIFTIYFQLKMSRNHHPFGMSDHVTVVLGQRDKLFFYNVPNVFILCKIAHPNAQM